MAAFERALRIEPLRGEALFGLGYVALECRPDETCGGDVHALAGSGAGKRARKAVAARGAAPEALVASTPNVGRANAYSLDYRFLGRAK